LRWNPENHRCHLPLDVFYVKDKKAAEPTLICC
jgi:hypothetical protein